MGVSLGESSVGVAKDFYDGADVHPCSMSRVPAVWRRRGGGRLSLQPLPGRPSIRPSRHEG